MSSPAAQLARVEGTRLLRNPAVWLAVAITVQWAIVVDPATSVEEEHFLLIGYGLVLPGFVMMAITMLAVRRSRSEGTDPLFDTLPVGHDRRTVGHGLSTLAAGALGLAVTAFVVAYRRPGGVLGSTEDTLPYGIDVPRPTVAQMLQGPLAVMVLCAFAVVIAQWVPGWLATLALVIPMAMQFLHFGLWNGAGLQPQNWWWPWSSGWVVDQWVGCTSESPGCELPLSGFDHVTPWWHLAYLVALVGFFVVLATFRHRRDGRTKLLLAVAVGTVVAFAAIQGIVYQRYVPYEFVGA